MERMLYEMEELIPIVAELSERYTGYESTSVTYEKASQLMEAVIYCINEFERSAGEGEGDLWADCETDRNRKLSAKEKISAKEAYQQGYQLVEAKVRAMKELYHNLLKYFRPYGNKALKDTVGAIPEFLKWYDIRYEPQNTILTLDYPLLTDLSYSMRREADSRCGAYDKDDGIFYRYTGIDAVYEYVKCISIEQRFLNRFPETYVKQVLRNYAEASCSGGIPLEDEEIFENICGILLADVAWHLVLKKKFDGMGILEEDRSRIQAVLGMYPLEEAKEMVGKMVKEFVLKFYGNDGRMWQYLKGECDNIVVRMMHSVV